jgi:hypothetical protein
MSNDNNERRELTAAELDLVAGGLELAAAPTAWQVEYVTCARF